MNYPRLKRELTALTPEEYIAGMGSVISAPGSQDMQKERFLNGYVALGSAEDAIDTYTRSTGDSMDGFTYAFQGAAIANMGLTKIPKPGLQRMLRKIEPTAYALAIGRTLSRATALRADDIPQGAIALTKEYPALYAGLQHVITTTHNSKRLSYKDADATRLGAAVAVLTLKELIDYSELAAIPTLSGEPTN